MIDRIHDNFAGHYGWRQGHLCGRPTAAAVITGPSYDDAQSGVLIAPRPDVVGARIGYECDPSLWLSMGEDFIIWSESGTQNQP
jgi:hypothetical protein